MAEQEPTKSIPERKLRRNLIDLTGQRFGRLVVVSFAGTPNDRATWNCVCDCGKECVAGSKHLRGGGVRSCGCYKRDLQRERMLPLDVRFWLKVDKTPGHGPKGDCWVWTAGATSRGYGAFYQEGQLKGAHIVSYDLAFGRVPDGLWVLHRCDNPPCVNPSHLFAGSHLDNMRDKTAKGRARGNTHNHKRAAKRC